MANLELAQKIKEKYPQYAQVPDDVLEQKIVSKYQQYAPMAGKLQKKTIGGFLKNVGKSAKDAVGGVASAFMHPIDTVTNLGGLAFDTGKFIGGDRSENNKAIQVGKFYKDRYGGLDNIGDTLYNDPVGALMDASSVVGGAGGALSLTGNAAKLGRVAGVGNKISKISRAMDPLYIPGRGMGNVIKNIPAKKIMNNLGKRIEVSGEGLLTKGLGNPLKQVELAKKSSKSVGDFIDEYKLYDRSPEAAESVKRGILKQYDDIGLRSGNKFSVGNLINQIDGEIDNLGKGSGRFSDSVQAQIQELSRRKQQLIEAVGGNEKLVPLNAGVDELLRFRRNAIDPDIPKSMFNLDAQGTGRAQGAKSMRDILRKNINASDPRLERLGLDYGMAKGMENIFEKAASRSDNRQAMNFTKLGSAGVGGMLGGIPGAAAGMAAEAIMNNPRSLAFANRSLKNIGKNIQNVQIPKVNNKITQAANNFRKGSIMIGKTNRTISPAFAKNNQMTVPKPQIAKQSLQPTNSKFDRTPIVLQAGIRPLKQVKIQPYKAPSKISGNVAFGKVKKVSKGNFY